MRTIRDSLARRCRHLELVALVVRDRDGATILREPFDDGGLSLLTVPTHHFFSGDSAAMISATATAAGRMVSIFLSGRDM
jgi:hypothetical protein